MNDLHKPRIKVAFLFLKGRNAVRRAIEQRAASDMPLYGTNHAAKALGDNFQCDTIEIGGFWSTMWVLRKYDIVFTHDALKLFALQRLLLCRRPRWIFLAVNTATILSHYPPRSLQRFAMIWTLKRMERIVCLSSAQRDFFVSIGILPERLELVLFGTDKAFFSPSNHDDGYVLSVGRDMGRDYRPLIEAAKEVNVPFHIVASRRNIDTEQANTITANVTLEYGRPWTEYRDLLERARISVVPLKKEGTPDASDCSGQTVALDSLATGKALIITRCAWASEYLKDGEHAIFVEPGDSKGIVDALNKLLAKADLRATLGREGRRLVEEKLNTERMGEGIARVIRTSSVLRSRRSSVQSART